MRLRHLGSRIVPSLIAVLFGWAAAMVATLPMQFVKIRASAFGGPAVLRLSLAEGTLVWGLWCLGIAAGGWLFGLVPVIMLVPEDWLLRHRFSSLALAATLSWIAVLVEFEAWKALLPYYHLAVRMFTLYSLVLVVYATVSAAVYLRLIASRGENS